MQKNIKAITEIPGWLNRLTGDGVPDDNATLYAKVPYLFRLVQIRCDALSAVPVKVYKLNDKDNANELEWPYPTQLSDLLWHWEAGSLLSGAMYGEIIANKNGYQKDIRYRNPFDMQVTYADGVVTIKQTSSGAVWRNDLTTGNYEIVYRAEYDPSQDVFPGVSAGKAANVDAKLLFALSKFPEMYFEGGAMPVTLLGIDSSNAEEIKRVETWFKKSATAIKNAFRVLGIRAGSITPTTLTPPLKDLAMPEISGEAKHNLSVAFGVPKTLLDSEAANYATAVEDRKSFYQDIIMPRSRKYESALNTQFLAKDGLRLEFDFNEMELFQDDEDARASRLLQYYQAGVPTWLALELSGIDLTDEQVAAMAESVVQNATTATQTPPNESKSSALYNELEKWRKMAEKRVKEGRELRDFESDIISPVLHASISGSLETVKTIEDVKAIFEQAREWESYP